MKSPALALFLHLTPLVQAAERPNILWITSEDNASHWLGCYGNAEARTPRLDALANEGLLFSRAYSNAPVCAVARATILTGVPAVTQGTQHMRSRYRIPPRFKPYVSYLREQGYYCTNNSKTDYNIKGNDAALWDACSAKAHYRNRPADQPFFAVFNLTVSHESSLFPATIAANRNKGIIPKTPRLNPASVAIPPYLPDLPEIRSDTAIYHDNVTALDTQVGKLLDELAAAGLADDTIVFYYSDHGGILPRGKRYLEDTGVRVPMLVRVPEKWRAFSPFKAGQAVDETVAFVDLAPTVLSLAGLEKPAQMPGRAFLGPKRSEPGKDDVVLLYADRFDEIAGMRRGITDGRWKYIRCFTPHLPAAPYSYYQFGQAGWTAWQAAWRAGKLATRFKSIWEGPQPVERLFDTRDDPWELHNLAAQPAHAERLAAMRQRLKAEMIKAADAGLVPEPMFGQLAPDAPLATYLAGRAADLPGLVDLAFAASDAQPAGLDGFRAKFGAADPLTRYWAAHGCLVLGDKATPAAGALVGLLGDPHSAVRVAAAHALVRLARPEGKRALLAELGRDDLDIPSQQHVIDTLTRINAMADVPDAWVQRTLQNPNAGEYLKRYAKRLRDERR